MDSEPSQLNREAGCLVGSRDAATGQTYFPPRAYAADGSMRETESVNLSTTGVLYSWTAMGDTHFGQVDLPEGVRIQCELAPGEHEIDWNYTVEITGPEEGDWRFRRA